MASGYNGVTLFFILSGFLLAMHHLDMPLSSAGRFWWARIARVYPLYLAVLLYVVAGVWANGTELVGLWRHVFLLQSWSRDYTMAYGYIAPAWSLSVEIFLYFAFPFLAIGVRRLNTRTALAVVVSIALTLLAAAWWFRARGELGWTSPGSSHRWLYRNPVTRLGDFTVGMALAVVYQRSRKAPRARLVGRGLAAVGAVVTVAIMCRGRTLFTAWTWDAVYVMPLGAIVLGLALSGNRLLASRPLVAAGAASYAFYLVHTRVMFALGAGQWKTIDVPSVVAEVSVFLLVLALSVGLHHMVEQPAHRWLRSRVAPPERAAARRPATEEPLDTSMR